MHVYKTSYSGFLSLRRVLLWLLFVMIDEAQEWSMEIQLHIE